MCKFIDISEHNTILSYDAIIACNLKGVIMKATEGTTYDDGTFEYNYTLLSGRIDLGAYHYLTATSSPITQAQHFWEKVKNKHFRIFPVLDVEENNLGDNAESYCEQFLQEFRNLSGQDMIIYSGRCYIQEHFSNEFRRAHSWWVADYGANECPEISNCNIIAWQYTGDDRSFAFTTGALDVSELYNEEQFFIDKYCPFSDETRTAIKDIATLQNELIIQGFTDSNGNELIIDGIAGELTLSACPILQEGAQGNITAWVQGQLEISADGIFGEDTRQAVIQYQENRSLVGDGIVGKNTWRKLLGM
jgi:hypothetical protein